MNNSPSNKKQFLKNLVINILNFLVNVGYGLFLTPFIISQLGISAFGVVQIAISLSFYMGMISTSLNQANNRYLSIYFTNGDKKNSISTITTVLTLYTLFFIITLPFLLYLSYNPTSFFNIEQPNINSSTYLFLSMVLSFILVLITTVFVSPAYVRNRLDIVQHVNILRIIIMGLAIFLLLHINKSLTSVGISYLSASVISTCYAIYLFRKYMPFYKFSISDYKRSLIKEIINLSFWTLVNYIGWLIFRQTDIILVNIFIGAEDSGKYAILVQLNTLLVNVATILSVVISPIVLLKYSQNRLKELSVFLYKAIKYQGLFISTLCSLLVVYAEDVLQIWLGKSFIDLAPYVQLMIFHFSVSQAIRPLFALNTAYNKMKIPGIFTLISGLLHVLASIGLLKLTSLGSLGVIISGIVFSIILNVIILPIYASKYMNESVFKMYYSMIPAIITQILIILLGLLLKSFIQINNIYHLVLVSGLNTLFVSIIIYFFMITKEEVSLLKTMIKEKTKRK